MGLKGGAEGVTSRWSLATLSKLGSMRSQLGDTSVTCLTRRSRWNDILQVAYVRPGDDSGVTLQSRVSRQPPEQHYFNYRTISEYFCRPYTQTRRLAYLKQPGNRTTGRGVRRGRGLIECTLFGRLPDSTATKGRAVEETRRGLIHKIVHVETLYHC